MSETRRKLKRIRVLEKVRQSKVDKESIELAEIREKKQAKAAELKNSQTEYLSGVEKLNQLRSSLIRENLQFMEETLDFLKSKWMRLFRELQDIERLEKNQMENLSIAHRELKSVGNLAAKLDQEARAELSRAEQKIQDERTIERSWAGHGRN
jgi:flagellar biosynthesis chaperone FliJ